MTNALEFKWRRAIFLQSFTTKHVQSICTLKWELLFVDMQEETYCNVITKRAFMRSQDIYGDINKSIFRQLKKMYFLHMRGNNSNRKKKIYTICTCSSFYIQSRMACISIHSNRTESGKCSNLTICNWTEMQLKIWYQIVLDFVFLLTNRYLMEAFGWNAIAFDLDLNWTAELSQLGNIVWHKSKDFHRAKIAARINM